MFYKDFGIIHAYTLECGYHANTVERGLGKIQNKDLKFALKKKEIGEGQFVYDLKPCDKPGDEAEKDIVGLEEEDLDEPESAHYKQPVAFYTE